MDSIVCRGLNYYPNNSIDYFDVSPSKSCSFRINYETICLVPHFLVRTVKNAVKGIKIQESHITTIRIIFCEGVQLIESPKLYLLLASKIKRNLQINKVRVTICDFHL